jgi:hypothetical protein
MPTPVEGPRRRPLVLVAALVCTLVAVPACTGATGGRGTDDSEIPGGMMITREQIQASNARHALEALERARTHLVLSGSGRDGGRGGIVHRGVDSMVRDGQVLIVINGAPVRGAADILIDIPAEAIAYIKVVSAREATPRYGTMAGNGMIYVRTTAGG